MSRPRVLISLITLNDLIYTETVKSLLALDLSDLAVEFHWVSHSITAAARNCAAAKAVGEGFDFLFFADLDMVFHPRTLKRLVSHNVDIVSGMYRARRGDPSPFFAFNFDPKTGIPMLIPEIDMTGPELLEVQGLPTGCLLIKTDVFRRLDDHARAKGETGPAPGQPYFYYESRLDRLVREEERVMQAAGLKGDVDMDVLRYKPAFGRGEDLRFCASCVEAGIRLYLDTRLVAGHLATRPMGTAALYD